MRSGVLALAVAVCLSAAPLADAQTSTADGVDAFIYGDYQRAAEILKPIAEQWHGEVDRIAAFFMATLYENGLGVPYNPIRACMLYVRASAGPLRSPLATQAERLLADLQTSIGTEQFEECVLLATTGFVEHEFQPVTFALEPGHSISLDLSTGRQSVGATITYAGKEQRMGSILGLSPAVLLLPVEHTELTVGRSALTRRHFIEFFFWTGTQKKQWSLRWSVAEVVRDTLAHVTHETLLTISAEQPPKGSSIDLRTMARLRVNDAGDAEWAVLTDPNLRSEVIEPDAERQEVAEQLRLRKAAEARVNWTRTRDSQRPPTLTYSDADGCGNLFAYGWSADRTEAITVRADKNALELSTTPQTFDLAMHQIDMELAAHVFERPRRSWPFCTDVRFLPDEWETWKAVSGLITIALSPPGVRARTPHSYRATVRIVGAEFVSASGVRIKQTNPITLTAIVGGFGGG